VVPRRTKPRRRRDQIRRQPYSWEKPPCLSAGWLFNFRTAEVFRHPITRRLFPPQPRTCSESFCSPSAFLRPWSQVEPSPANGGIKYGVSRILGKSRRASRQGGFSTSAPRKFFDTRSPTVCFLLNPARARRAFALRAFFAPTIPRRTKPRRRRDQIRR